MAEVSAAPSNVKLIREFFAEGKYGRTVTMDELKALTPAERKELGEMIRAI